MHAYYCRKPGRERYSIITSDDLKTSLSQQLFYALVVVAFVSLVMLKCSCEVASYLVYSNSSLIYANSSYPNSSIYLVLPRKGNRKHLWVEIDGFACDKEDREIPQIKFETKSKHGDKVSSDDRPIKKVGEVNKTEPKCPWITQAKSLEYPASDYYDEKRGVCVLQYFQPENSSLCGVASVDTVLIKYGLNKSLSKLAREFGFISPNSREVFIGEIASYFNWKTPLKARVIRYKNIEDLEDWHNKGYDIILELRVGHLHYAPLYDFWKRDNKTWLLLLDPAEGFTPIYSERFKEIWHLRRAIIVKEVVE